MVDIYDHQKPIDGPLSFRHLYNAEYRPGEDELTNYRAYRRKRLYERKLTKRELDRREKIAQDLPDAEFKKRYGKDWKSVKMATATNMAKKEEITVEALDLMQRIQRARLIKRIKTKIKVGKERAKRKVADIKKLRKRARKAARNILAKKLTSGIPKGKLNFKRKQEIEKRLDKMGPAIDRISKKMFPLIRKKEIEKKRAK